MARRLHLAVLAALSISYLLCLLPLEATGANVNPRSSEGRLRGQRGRSGEAHSRGEEEDGGKQWDGGSMSFPYLMMMMSSSHSTAVPSPWLIPVVIASCVMLGIRGTMDKV